MSESDKPKQSWVWKMELADDALHFRKEIAALRARITLHTQEYDNTRAAERQRKHQRMKERGGYERD